MEESLENVSRSRLRKQQQLEMKTYLEAKLKESEEASAAADTCAAPPKQKGGIFW